MEGGLDEVAEQQPGLRFDIYERVHLQEGARSIRELDEVELVPHIQVVSQSEQALLKGHLRLSGTYTSEGEDGKRELEHQIPVEITLPASRVGNAQDLFVEIENFDIDVLSPRSLNVTGVLSLHGVEMVSAPETNWQSEEEMVFVHRPWEFSAAPVSAAPLDTPEAPPIGAEAAREYALNSPPIEPQTDPRSEPFVHGGVTAPGIPPSAAYPFPANVTTHVVEPTPVQAIPAAEAPPETPAVQPGAKHTDIDVDVNVEETEIFVGSADAVEESELLPEVHLHAAEEKKDVKVAFGSKKVAGLASEAAYGIKSLIQKSSSIFQEKRKPEEPQAAASASEPQTDGIEWKRLFLSSASVGQEFRKLKMAIVQKEETLETIAQRYQINPRELQLLNRLQDGEITAGQVIYIPR